MAENPYAPPRSRVEDAAAPPDDSGFIAEGRGVPAGNGWRWISDAWDFMAGQRWTFVGVMLLLVVVQIIAQMVPIIGPLAVTLLSPALIGGFVIGCEAVRRGGQLEVGHLFAGFQRHSGKLIGIGALSLAVGIVGGIVMIAIVGVSVVPLFEGGEPNPEELASMIRPILLAALVVMALSLPVTMAILFATPLVVLRDADIVTALKMSFVACLKNILPFLVWSVVMLVFGTLASIPLLIGWFLLGPVMMVSLYLAYRDIFYDR